MIKVLVSAIGGDIGQGILKSLRLGVRGVKIIGADADPQTAGLFMCDKGYAVSSAKNSPKKYVKDIIKICKKEKIDIVFSAQPYELNAICPLKNFLENKTGAVFVVQTGDVWNLCMDKFQTHGFLKKNGIRSPETFKTKDGFEKLVKKHGYPVLMKAKTSFGSGFHDFVLIRNKKEFKRVWKGAKNAIIQEYITNKENDEYTVGVFLDKNSRALGAIPMRRDLRFGLTWRGVADNYPDIVDTAIKTAQSIGAVGPCNVQLRRGRDGEPCVIEINPRISSTTIFRAKLGFNEAKASVDYFLKNKTPVFSVKSGAFFKIWDELIVPLKVLNKSYAKRI